MLNTDLPASGIWNISRFERYTGDLSGSWRNNYSSEHTCEADRLDKAYSPQPLITASLNYATELHHSLPTSLHRPRWLTIDYVRFSGNVVHGGVSRHYRICRSTTFEWVTWWNGPQVDVCASKGFSFLVEVNT
jgi:hypothetical protein